MWLCRQKQKRVADAADRGQAIPIPLCRWREVRPQTVPGSSLQRRGAPEAISLLLVQGPPTPHVSALPQLYPCSSCFRLLPTPPPQA